MKRLKLGVVAFVLLSGAVLLWSGCAENSSDPVVLGPGPDQLTAKDGFIAANQRVGELQAGQHPVIACAGCHAYATGGPVDRDCADCHTMVNVNHPALAKCADCHMPKATKQSTSTGPFAADVRSHVMRIRPAPERKESMFVEEQGFEFVEIGPGLTLDLACYGCHQDENGNGGNFSSKTLRQLADKAPYIHASDAAAVGKEDR
jgi:hypothetical protein